MPTSVYVGNLPFSTNDSDLEALFAPYGDVVSAKVIRDRETGRSRGFGFVEMNTMEMAQKAIKGLDQSDMDGRQIKVNLARPKRSRY